MKQCHGCLGWFEKITEDAISHPYIGAIAECWDVCNQISAKEFSDPEYFKSHRIAVDTYGAQHIGNQEDRRARQSANVHLIALYLKLNRQKEDKEVLSFLKEATKIKRDWPPVIQRQNPQWLTVHDVVVADTPSSHSEWVFKWGQSVLDAYKDSYQDIIRLYQDVMADLAF